MKQSDRDTSSRGQLIGLSFKEGGFMPCEDDEDLCDVGSGGGQNQDGWGYSDNSNIFDASNQIDSKLKPFLCVYFFETLFGLLYLNSIFKVTKIMKRKIITIPA